MPGTRPRAVTALGAAVFLASCLGDAGGPTPVPRASTLTLVAGDQQAGVVGRELPDPIVVSARDSAGRPLAGVPVTFRAVSGGGRVTPGVVATDTAGLARARWTLGRSTAEAQRVDVLAAGIRGRLTVAFAATALPGPAASLAHLAGDGQVGEVGRVLADSLALVVRDAFGNGVPGVVVAWRASAGSVQPDATPAGAGGVARAAWELGPAVGPQEAEAAVTGVPPLVFGAAAVAGPAVGLSVQPDSVGFSALGDTARLLALAVDRFGNLASEPVPAWTSLAPGVAAVDSGGMVRAVGNGRAAVVATAGPAADTVAVTVRQEAAAVVVQPESARVNALGRSVRFSAAVLDRNRFPLSDLPIRWRTFEPAVASVDDQGVVVALAPGSARVEAAAAGLTDTATLRVVQVVAALALAPDSARLLVGDTLRLSVAATDSGGTPVAAPPASFRSTEPAVATVDWTGLVRAVAPGRAAVVAHAGAAADTIAIEVRPGTPAIASVSPTPLLPGATATIVGSGFHADPGSNAVRVAGVPVTVVAGDPGSLTVRLPARSAFPCHVTRPVPVQVTTGGVAASVEHPLEAGLRHTLGPGEAAAVLDPADVRCQLLAGSGARYLVAVVNTGGRSGDTVSFSFRGASSTAPGPRTAVAPPARRAPPQAEVRDPDQARRDALHARVLEASRRLLARLGRPAPPGAAARAAPAAGTTLAVGDTVALRVPAIYAPDPCAAHTPVRARVVSVGTRAVVLEDVEAPLAGRMDSTFRQIGAEFDGTVAPLLDGSFGDMLAMDPRLDGNGRIFLLFTRVVNDMGGLAGFVWAGDFYDPASCPAGNAAEVVYGGVPTTLATDFSAGSLQRWLWGIRSTLVHEAKHVVSYAERFARSAPALEEAWLEEGTARAAEELFARLIFGYDRLGNTDYLASIHCEVRPTTAACAGKPYVMVKHFAGLYDFLASPETRSPLGSVAAGDVSFYGSAWSLLRWAADHHGGAEADFFRALTTESARTGVANLEARTRRDFPSLLAGWALAGALDDAAGSPPASPEHVQPSWDTRDVFAGMHRELGYARAFPLIPRAVPFGSFAVDVRGVPGGSAAFFDLSGSRAGEQAIEVAAPGGGAPDPRLGIAVVRIE